MSQELIVHGAATSEDIFFGHEPEMTDWDTVLADAAQLKLDELLAEAHKMEPMAAVDVNDHEMWILQQKIRICLRVMAKKPLVAAVCPSCGIHLRDPVLYTCLWCEELGRQVGNSGGRGSCWFLQPTYDPKTRCWGLLYYYSRGRETTYLFWLAQGYKTLLAAQLALYPLALFQRWLDRKYNGLYREWDLAQRVFDLDEVMRMSLPLTPQQVEEIMRAKMREDMQSEHNILGYCIHRAISDYDYEHRD